MAMIWLYSCREDPKKVNKDVGVQIAALKCDIVEPCSLTNPKLILSSPNVDVSETNYFYLDGFNRYYYIRNMNLLRNNRVEIEGEVDVLKSFAGGINGLVTLVTRQEYVYNGDLVDDEIVPRIRRQIKKKVIGNVGNTISYALTVTGGDAI